MSDNSRLNQVWSDNVIGNQIGGQTDGISPEVAADLGYFPPEHYAQLKRERNLTPSLAPEPAATPADKKTILVDQRGHLIDPNPGPSVKITDYYQNLLDANQALADIMKKRGQLKQPHTWEENGYPAELRERIAELETTFAAKFSAAFGEVAMLGAAQTDQDRAVIRFDRNKYLNSFRSRHLPPEGSDANHVSKIRRYRDKSTKRYQKALDSYRRA
jgi:hypothetical protein